MKVLLVEPGASWSTADVAFGLAEGLRAHGVELVRYRLDVRMYRAHTWLQINYRKTKKTDPTVAKPTAADVSYQAGVFVLERALRHQVDVVLIVSAMYLHPDVIILLKRAGLRVVVLFTETPYDLDHELKVAALVDGCWTCERTAVAAFAAVTAFAGYLPHAWSSRHRAGPQTGDGAVPAHDVVFVGSGFPERAAWLGAVDWTGIDLGLYGTWDQLGSRHRLRDYVRGGLQPNDRTAALYRRARIGLNLYRTSKGGGGRGHITGAESLNPRAYELARCGVFHLSTARAEVVETFGDLVPLVTTPADTSALIRHWLTDGRRRAAMAADLPACVAESTWTARAARVIADLQTLLGQRAA
jgi:spore maturation protein CgeB